MKYQFYNFFWYLVDLIFPPTCGGCQAVGGRWCENCQKETPKVTPPICKICGQNTPTTRVCQRCKTTRPHYQAIRAWAEFGGPIRNALHDLKYRKNMGLGSALSIHLADILQHNNWKVDLVIPVPLGEERLKQRGYNQAALLAQPLAHKLQLPYQHLLLSRVKETQSQVKLSLIERQNNVKNAFQAAHQGIQGKRVLVIDDVTTSGATINACADALTKAGAEAVFGLTVARAKRHS